MAYESQIMPVDDSTVLVLARPRMAFARGASVIEGKSGQEIAAGASRDEGDELVSPAAELADSNFQGIRYNKQTGEITGYVLPADRKSDKNTEACTIPREPDDILIELAKQHGRPVPPPKVDTFHIEPAAINLAQFESNCRNFAHAYPRDGENPGRVLVRPCVIREVRKLDKERLLGPGGNSGLPPL